MRNRLTVPYHTIALLSLCTVFAPCRATECNPPCRTGYTCVDAQCVSACNPPCPTGYRCDAEKMDCVPMATPQAQATRQSTATPRAKTSGYCKEHAACAEGYLCFDNECEKQRYIETAGNVMFHFTEVIYGLGVAYNTIAPLIWSLGYDHDYASEYLLEPDNDDAIPAVAPQSGVYVLFGTLNQISKIRQARFLRELGATPSTGLITVGWALHGLAMATTAINAVGYASTSKGFMVSTAFINAAVLLSSYVVNTAGYVHQRKLLRQAVSAAAAKQHSSSSLEILPYASLCEGGGGGGLALRF